MEEMTPSLPEADTASEEGSGGSDAFSACGGNGAPKSKRSNGDSLAADGMLFSLRQHEMRK
jgi:hypothetical protein